MKYLSICLMLILILLTGCGNRQGEEENRLSSIQIVDRNGFKETISAPERLRYYEHTDFFAPQPYEKVMRVYTRNTQGKTPSKMTTYHSNGELWQYLEVVNGRARGYYREWHENGVLRLELTVIEGLGDLSEEAQLSWIFDGPSRAWDSEGHLLAEIYYEKGKLQGNALYYHPNGKVSKIIPYENDRIEGDLIYYDEKGSALGKTPYRRGLKQGIATFKGDRNIPPYSEEYDQDLLMEATYQDFSGKILATIENGKGKQALFQEGKLQSIQEYQKGIPQGEVQRFDARGRLHNLFHIKEGMKHGEEWVYYTAFDDLTPQPKLYIQWSEDVAQGMMRTWYENGALESERELYDNQKHGVSSCWYRDGSLMMVEEYENDQLYRGTYMKKGDPTPVSTVDQGEGTATLYDPDGFFIKRVSYKKGIPVD